METSSVSANDMALTSARRPTAIKQISKITWIHYFELDFRNPYFSSNRKNNQYDSYHFIDSFNNIESIYL